MGNLSTAKGTKMTEFPRIKNGTITCPSCGRVTMADLPKCDHCGTDNPLSHVELDILTNIPEEEYDRKVGEILKEKGINVEEYLNKNKGIKENKEKSEGSFPNGPVKWGIIFTLLSLFMGDILKVIGWGFIFQQTALSIGFGTFGLGLILYGSFKVVIIKLDKLIDDKGAE